MRTLILSLCLLPALALADEPRAHCDPASATIDDTIRAPLFERLKATRSQVEGQRVADSIWRDFTHAPDPHAQDLLDTGMRRIRQGSPDTAEPLLDELIDYCPEYAEGWNQRAFARFLTGDYDGALEDIDRVLDIEPRHFGALSGKALTLLKQGRQQLAEKVLRDAVAIHPWITERHLLPKGERI